MSNLSRLVKNKLSALLLLIVAIGFAFLSPWLMSVFNNPNGFYGLAVNKPAINFNLDSTDGGKVSLDSFGDDYLYVMFGFTHCNETCSMQLANLLNLKKLFRHKPARFVFITLDPKRDTLEALRQYFQHYDSDFTVLRPESFKKAQELARRYQEYAIIEGDRLSDEEYQINHNGYIFVIGPNKQLELLYTSTQLNHSKMLEDLNKLIKT